LYIQIQEHFKEQIRAMKLKPNDRIPTEKELMKQFGVSRITVANALAELAKDGWIYRIPGRGSFVRGLPQDDAEVLAAQKENGIAPQERARQTVHVGPVRRMIGLLLPSFEDYFAIRLVLGIRNMLDSDRYYLNIVLTGSSPETEKEMIRELIGNGAAGLIIFPVDAQTYSEEILTLKMNRFPFVLIDRHLPGVETHYVSSDNHLGAKLAVDYLWELGHRRIAICSDSPQPTSTVTDRINGYMDALKAKKSLIDPSLILTDFHVDYSRIDEQHPLYRYLNNNMATAFITLNARLGMYIHSIVNRIGLQVPEDLSILTFDNPSLSYDIFGGYTHIAQGEEEMGKESARVLMDIIDSPGAEDGYRKIILKPQLILKQTTGPLKQAAKK
jgi:GntR family transcriptional regulator of arabinose operon